MRFLTAMIFCVAICGFAAAQQTRGRAAINGPSAESVSRHPGVIPHEVLSDMFIAVEKHWLPEAYEGAGKVDFRAEVSADLPPQALDKRAGKVVESESMSFSLTADGVSAPDGRYRMKVTGDFGEIDMINNHKSRYLAGHDFRMFADSPIRNRQSGANLSNYRSWARQHVRGLREALIGNGSYRTVYLGSGTYEGRLVDLVSIYKPRPVREDLNGKKQPIQMNKIWTFWQEGGYEVWVDRENHMPVAIFYTNTQDNIFANLAFHYNEDLRPTKIVIINNSPKADGFGEILLTYDEQGLLSGGSLSYNGNNGISLRLDASLLFDSLANEDAFRVFPPFGFKKVNRDHLQLLLLTRISGGLLKLKKYGVNLQNFKF